MAHQMRNTIVFALALVASMALFLPSAAQAFTFDLYETIENTADGTPCEYCPAQLLPENVVDGWVILMESSGDPTDQSLWSDAVHFFDYTDEIEEVTLQYIQILSDGCRSGDEGDVSCFPSYADVTSGLYAFILETDTPTVYDAGNIYNIYSDGPDETQVPEPSALLLLGSGLAGLALWGRKLLKATSS
jgi:PEP-CTERM motif